MTLHTEIKIIAKILLTKQKLFAIIIIVVRYMERWSSWFKAPVLKTGVRVTVPWVRIPLFPPFKYNMETYSSGRRGRFAKPLVGATLAWVRIPSSPP